MGELDFTAINVVAEIFISFLGDTGVLSGLLELVFALALPRPALFNEVLTKAFALGALPLKSAILTRWTVRASERRQHLSIGLLLLDDLAIAGALASDGPVHGSITGHALVALSIRCLIGPTLLALVSARDVN